MRRYLGDILFFILAMSIAFLLAGTPEILRIPATRPTSPGTLADAPETKSQERTLERTKNDTAVLEKRNIFALSGSYQDIAPVSLPDNPYVLIGIVGGGETTKAFFREYTGRVVNVLTGERMIDGFRVIAIDRPRIVLKRGNEKKIFNVFNPTGLPVIVSDNIKKIENEKIALVAVLEGSEKKAVFRNVDGSLSVLKTGQSLPDGSSVICIDARQVKLKRGKVEKEIALETKASTPSQARSVNAGKYSAENQPDGQAERARTKRPGINNRIRRNFQENNP